MGSNINSSRSGATNRNTPNTNADNKAGNTHNASNTHNAKGTKGSAGPGSTHTAKPTDTYTGKSTTTNTTVSTTIPGNATVSNAPVMNVAQLLAKASQGFAATLPRISQMVQNVVNGVTTRVNASATAVQQAYDTGGAQAAAAELERQAEALGGSPAAVDMLLNAASPTLDLIARDMA